MRRDSRPSRLFLLTLLAGLLPTALIAETVKEVRKKMGSRFEVTAVHASPTEAHAAVEAAYAEIDRIEARISSWRPTSETSQLNAHAGQGPFEVSDELFGLIRRAMKVSDLTGGAFDITFAGVGALWDFKSTNPYLPDPDELADKMTNVGHDLITLDAKRKTVTLARPGVRIGFGAIGKGYAANRAVRAMKDRGITAGVVNAGGDLFTFGHKESGAPWTVGIADPLARDAVFATLEITDHAAVTSGDYESFIEIDGVRYAHILDPRTGYPIHGVRAVTILCPDAELADALATGISVLGLDAGLALLNQLNGIEGLIVDDAGAIHFSRNLQSSFIPPENPS